MYKQCITCYRAQILAQTADVASLFATMSVNSLSAFKKVFLANELSAPTPGQPYTYPPPRGAASPAAAPASAAAGSAVAGPGGSPAHGQEAAVQSADDTPLASLESDDAVSKAYDELKGGWEALKWRMLPRPGGAVMKPDKFCAPPHDAPCLRVDPGAPAAGQRAHPLNLRCTADGRRHDLATLRLGGRRR